MSGGEDGVVNMWDLREKNPVNRIQPFKNDKIARSDIGKWIGAVSINEDWLVSFAFSLFQKYFFFILNSN